MPSSPPAVGFDVRVALPLPSLVVDETARGRNKELVDFDDDDADEDEVDGADITATPPDGGGGEVKAEEEHPPTAGLSRGVLRVSESGAPTPPPIVVVVGESLRRVGEPRQRAASAGSSSTGGRLLPNDEVRSAMPPGVRRAVCGA